MRVTMGQSEVQEQNMRGLRTFKGQPGNRYRLIFPVDEHGQEFLFTEPIHQINLGRIKGKARCLKDYMKFIAGTNELELDPVSGKPKNDGTCPYCQLGKLASKLRSLKMEQYRTENPDADEKAQKDYFKELSKNFPVGQPELGRGFIVAVVQTDAGGMNPVIVDGKPVIDIRFLQMSPNQYTKKFKPALAEFEYKVNFTELFFDYPAGDEMTSAKDMTINPIANPFVVKFPDLKVDIIEKIKKMNLEGIEDQVFTFRPETVQDVNRKIAPVQHNLESNMTDEEKAQVAEAIEKGLVNIDTADGASVLDAFNIGTGNAAEEAEGEGEDGINLDE